MVPTARPSSTIAAFASSCSMSERFIQPRTIEPSGRVDRGPGPPHVNQLRRAPGVVRSAEPTVLEVLDDVLLIWNRRRGLTCLSAGGGRKCEDLAIAASSTRPRGTLTPCSRLCRHRPACPPPPFVYMSTLIFLNCTGEVERKREGATGEGEPIYGEKVRGFGRKVH